jgi:hypothetical protein
MFTPGGEEARERGVAGELGRLIPVGTAEEEILRALRALRVESAALMAASITVWSTEEADPRVALRRTSG